LEAKFHNTKAPGLKKKAERVRIFINGGKNEKQN